MTPEQTDKLQTPAALDWADPSELPVEEVRDVFLTLSKALRAYQLYDPNNPVYRRFVSNLSEALGRVWETQDSIQVLIEEDRFTWMGEEVYRNESRSDSLAFMFYRDGIRDVTFKAGFEESEIEALLEALHRTRNVGGEAEDLVTMLWDMDMSHFSYSAIEVGGEGQGMDLSTLGELSDFDASALLEEELGEEAEGAESDDSDDSDGTERDAPETVRAEDFNPTLYALDPGEQEFLRAELEKEMRLDLRGQVLNALFDRLEEPGRPERQAEIMDVLRSLLPNFLSRGALSEAARVIQEVGEIQARPGVLPPEVDSMIEGLKDDLSAPDAVEELIRALEDGSISPDAEELSSLLQYLRPRALTALLKGAEETRDPSTAGVLLRAIQAMAEGDPEVVIRLLSAEDPSVVSGAIRLVGEMKIVEAGSALVGLLEHGPRQVRKLVVETAAVVPSSVLAGALGRLLRDEDRELRVTAAKVLGDMEYAPAAEDFRAVIDDRRFRDADVSEKVVIFEAFGLVAGSKGISFLDRMLNGRGILGRREPPEMRAGAALGLGKIGGAEASAALGRASRDDDPVVRSAVGRAQKGAEVEA